MADSAASSKEDEPTENTWTATLLPTLHDYRLTFSKHLTARSWWSLLLLGYCLVSVLLFTGRIYTLVADGFHSDDAVISGLDSITTEQCLQKLTTVRVTADGFHPYYVRQTAPNAFGPDAISACGWVHEKDLTESFFVDLGQWVEFWNGPVSLVLVTQYSLAYLSEIIDLRLSSSSSVAASLNLHVVQLKPQITYSPNALLNLARLFAPTTNVLLIPSSFSSVSLPPGSHPTPSTRPTLMPFLVDHSSIYLGSTLELSSYPFAPLSPLLLPRAYPLWCTERFFPPLSRSADWDECTWEFWLDSYGSLGSTTTSGPGSGILAKMAKGVKKLGVIVGHGKHNANSRRTLLDFDWKERYGNDSDVMHGHGLGVVTSIRKKLDHHFKYETCTLAMRKLDMLQTDENGVQIDIDVDGPERRDESAVELQKKQDAEVPEDTPRMMWLKEVCKEWKL